jgi:mRNA interferase RelE/StbE
MKYKVVLRPGVRKALKKIIDNDHQAIMERLESLAEVPRPENVKQLTGVPLLRVRVRDFRIVYNVDDGNRKLTVVKIARRSERTYKGL